MAAVDVRLTEQIEALGGRMSSTAADAAAHHAEAIQSVRSQLAGLEARLDAALADRSEARPGREEDLHLELELLEAWERESSEQLAALRSAVGAEVQRLSLEVAASSAERVSTADVEALRREIAEGVAAALSALEGRTMTASDLTKLRDDLGSQMVEQLRLGLQEALKHLDARATAAANELGRRLEGSVTNEEFVALRSELKEVLGRNMSSAQAELQRRMTLLDDAMAEVKARVSLRIDQMASLVSTEAAAAAEQAIVGAPPLQALREQIQQIRVAVTALEKRFPTP